MDFQVFFNSNYASQLNEEWLNLQLFRQIFVSFKAFLTTEKKHKNSVGFNDDNNKIEFFSNDFFWFSSASQSFILTFNNHQDSFMHFVYSECSFRSKLF